MLYFIMAVVKELSPSPAAAESAPGVRAGRFHTPMVHAQAKKGSGSFGAKVKEVDRKRQRCAVKGCQGRTSNWCKQCGVFLHLNNPNEGGYTCWSDWHSQ